MTIQELIEKLHEFDLDSNVYILFDSNSCFDDIKEIFKEGDKIYIASEERKKNGQKI